MIIKHPIKDFHIDDTYYKNLIETRKRIEKDKDICILICGDPGNGKSTFAGQTGYVLSPSIFNDNCFHSTVEDFRKYAIDLEEKGQNKGKVNIHDEARETGGTNVITKRIKRHWDFVYENRFLNMIQIFIQSDYWNTPKDIIFHRALFMVWVVEDERWNNGIFLFYNKSGMRNLYLRGKKRWDRTPKGYAFKGRFVKTWAANPDYLKQKADNFREKYKESLKEKTVSIKDAVDLAYKRNPDFDAKKFSEVFNCSRRNVYHYI